MTKYDTELGELITKVERLLDEGRINAQSVNILQKQKAVLKEENRRLQGRIDELIDSLQSSERAIVHLTKENLELRGAVQYGGIMQIWTNDGEL